MLHLLSALETLVGSPKTSLKLVVSVKVVASLRILFSFVLTHLFFDVELSYIWDLEDADETALLSNSSEQCTRLLHLVQKEASVRGLLPNFDKCAHLPLNPDACIPFSPNLRSQCDCSSDLGHTPPTELVPLSDEVKYLGVFLDSMSNNKKNASFQLQDFCVLSYHTPPSWKLTVYRSILQSIRLYAMDRAQLSFSQLNKLNHIHLKSMSRVVKDKSSFLNPSDESCSNQFLAGLAFDSRRVITPS